MWIQVWVQNGNMEGPDDSKSISTSIDNGMSFSHKKNEELILWTVRSNQSILKEINPEYPLEGLMMKLKLQYFGHLMQSADSLETDAGKD